MDLQSLQQLIKDYQDFPQAGVVFRDISPVLRDPAAFKFALDGLVELAKKYEFNKIAAVDARGFLLGSPLADRLGKALVLCRKPDKLPGELITTSYGYEYSASSLSIQRDAIQEGDRVLVVDDVLATGNSFLAACDIITQLGGRIPAMLCLVEITTLPGRKLLDEKTNNTPIESLLKLEA
jgi:adenine phosphoribosyltransferase